jgi:large conductance mechanosensitive channel
MIKGFTDFLTRGNLIETAVALVMALATTALVAAFVESLITPLIGAIVGETDFSSLTFTINDSEFFYGSFLSACITFVATAAAIYFFIVKPYQAYQARRGVTPETRECPECLSSIPLNAKRCANCAQPLSAAV